MTFAAIAIAADWFVFVIIYYGGAEGDLAGDPKGMGGPHHCSRKDTLEGTPRIWAWAS